jgi:predicted nuclease with TOPRIM domain
MDSESLRTLRGILEDKVTDLKNSHEHLFNLMEEVVSENEELSSRVDELEAELEEDR